MEVEAGGEDANTSIFADPDKPPGYITSSDKDKCKALLRSDWARAKNWINQQKDKLRQTHAHTPERVALQESFLQRVTTEVGQTNIWSYNKAIRTLILFAVKQIPLVRILEAAPVLYSTKLKLLKRAKRKRYYNGYRRFKSLYGRKYRRFFRHKGYHRRYRKFRRSYRRYRRRYSRR